jgi:hypothetical protein
LQIARELPLRLACVVRRPGAVFVVLAALIACGSPEPVGQYGVYRDQVQRLHLDSGGTVDLFRVKLWSFRNGDAPALQLEYAATSQSIDSTHAYERAKEIWPSIAPYVEGIGVHNAIITATVLQMSRAPMIQASLMRHFGFVFQQDPNGIWHCRGHPDTLPLARRDSRIRLTNADGVPISVEAFSRSFLTNHDSI